MKFGIKSIFLLSTLCVSTLAAGIFCACGEDKTVTITFKAAENDDIVITAKVGEAIAPPSVPEKTGNRGEWEPFDFENVTEDAVVNAVYETEGLEYTRLATGAYEVSRGTMSSDTTELFLPTRHSGVRVTQIAERGFEKCNQLISIYIPENMKVGGSSFLSCSALQEAVLSEGVTAERNAFALCESLISVSLPKTMTTVSAYMFSGCSSLQSIELPDGVTSIGHSAFKATALLSINIPGGVKSIDEEAFSACTSLQTAVISDGVTAIGNRAFSSCTSLQTMSIPASVTWIGNEAFSECSAMQSINIPYGVATIGASAFNSCESLQSVTLPENGRLDRINDKAFLGCHSLQSFVIPNSVTYIGAWAFADCPSLKSITIPRSVITMEFSAFAGWREDQTIYVKGYTKRPEGWDQNWSASFATVVWDA